MAYSLSIICIIELNVGIIGEQCSEGSGLTQPSSAVLVIANNFVAVKQLYIATCVVTQFLAQK